MHPFQKRALERICQKHGLDTQLIDDSLTFEENKRVLESLTVKTAEDLINWAKTLEDMERLTDLADTYGIPYGFESGNPLILMRVFIRINRQFLRVFQNRIKPFQKHIKEIAKGYFKLEATPSEVFNIIARIQDLKPRILRISKPYDHNWQYLPIYGWIPKTA